jgi:hypothetical protein
VIVLITDSGAKPLCRNSPSALLPCYGRPPLGAARPGGTGSVRGSACKRPKTTSKTIAAVPRRSPWQTVWRHTHTSPFLDLTGPGT